MTLAGNRPDDFTDIVNLAVEESGTGIWDRDVVTGEIRYSRGWWRILGYAEMPARSHIEAAYARVHPDDLDYVRQTMQDHFDRRTARYEVEHRLRCADGSYKWVLSRGMVVERDIAGRPVRMVGTTTDITTLRTLAEELAREKAEARFRAEQLAERTREQAAAHRLAQIGSWQWDLAAGEIRFSPETWQLAGGEARNRPVTLDELRALFPPADRRLLLRRFVAGLKAGQPVSVQHRLTAFDGRTLDVVSYAEPIGEAGGRARRLRGVTQDVTAYRRMQAALRSSEALAFRVLEATRDAVIVFDRGGRARFANARAARFAGAGQEIVGNRLADLFPGTAGHRLAAGAERAAATGAPVRLELSWAPTGRWLEADLYPGEDDISLFVRDVTERKLTQDRLIEAAETDSLTGEFNRRGFFTRLEAALTAQARGRAMALICADVNYFTEINDSFGHGVGDEVLKTVARRLKSCLRPRDILARTGGDEFMILLNGMRRPGDATTLARRIVGAMEERFELGDLSLRISLSIGLAIASLADRDAARLCRHADLALYETRTEAPGSFRVFTPAMEQESLRKRQLKRDLADALGRSELELAFQPIVRTADGTIAAAETLLRWNHPEQGRIPPAEFIPLAEESGLIAPIGAWVLRQACAAACRWPEAVGLSVNVSPRQIELADLPALVRDVLEATGLAPRRLHLEITETVLVSRNRHYLATLHRLRELGVRLVLDDFGTGYSSLAQLDAFRFDAMKIDQSFLRRIRAETDETPILNAIVGMATAIRMPITVEGVETQVQLNHVRRLGAACVQGFYFGQPVNEVGMQGLLARGLTASR
ncbi:GGDEF domain-containing phosphodiesterase [Acidiphilium sp.]|uniref:bifunctional diguanylate cyclase/phosphodiesterase n=1 Tax=Acidiphilium sp. TaxID=527 RepID=UPI00258DB91A|nr:GGDEF domain-containing phosphodiesterase [Acidiphilium sp.]